MPDVETDLDEDLDTTADTPLLKDLRRQLRDAKKQAKEGEDAKAELEKMRRDKVLDSAEFADLKPKQREALSKLHEGEFTAEALKATALDLGFITDTEGEQIDAELTQQERVTGAAATGTTARTTGAITTEMAADWSPERWMRFEQQHPDAAERLLQGEPVTGIAFT